MFFGGNTGSLIVDELLSNETIERKLKKLFERRIPNNDDDFEDDDFEGFKSKAKSYYIVGTPKEGELVISIIRSIENNSTELSLFGNPNEYNNSIEKIKLIEKEFGGLVTFQDNINNKIYKNEVLGIKYSQDEEKQKIINETLKASISKLDKELKSSGFELDLESIKEILTDKILEKLNENTNTTSLRI